MRNQNNTYHQKLVTQAIQKIEWIDDLRAEIKRLTMQAETLLSDYIPSVYKDGDTRLIPESIYRKARVLIEQSVELRKVLLKDPTLLMGNELIWQGQYGTLILKPAKEVEL